MNFICLVAQFYVALWPIGEDSLDPTTFFESYLAGPIMIALYLGWKAFSWNRRPEHRQLYIRTHDIDLSTGMRAGQAELISGPDVSEEQKKASMLEIAEENRKNGAVGWIKSAVRNVF